MVSWKVFFIVCGITIVLCAIDKIINKKKKTKKENEHGTDSADDDRSNNDSNT